MTCILGIDPGLSGAIAFYFPDHGVVSVYDMPVADKWVVGSVLAEQIIQLKPNHAFVELVGAMPKQGLSSTFRFGCAFGSVTGVLGALKVPFTLATPAKWKRAMGLNSDKERSRAEALRLFPQNHAHFTRKKDEGRAEAALLALYGARDLGLEPSRDAA